MAGLRTPLERILITFWVGAIWVVGYVVAPTLFAMLERSVAGDVAGREILVPATYIIDETGSIIFGQPDVDYRTRVEPQDILEALRSRSS